MIFYHEQDCEDGLNECEMAPVEGTNLCKKFNLHLSLSYHGNFVLFKKCSECIIESKKIYPELYL